MTNIDQSRKRRSIGSILGANSSGRPPHISLLNDRFWMVDAAGQKQPVETFDPQTGPYMDCVMIDALECRSRTFWGEGRTYDPNNPSRPICFSDNGIAPSANANEPQSPTCNGCEWSVWGKAISFKGKKIPACSQSQKLAVMIPGVDMVFLLQIPPASLTALNIYNSKFAGQDFEVDGVLTRIDFKPGEKVLQFRPIERISAELEEQRDQLLDAGATDNIVGRGDRPYEGPVRITHQQETAPLGALLGANPNPPAQQFPQQPQSQQFIPNPPPDREAPKKGPGRPKKIAASETVEPPFDTKGNSGGQFGIQEPSQPGAQVSQAMDNFFGRK